MDFHHGSHQVPTRSGHWITPLLLGVIDDHPRLMCHLQWYRDETLVHGFCQALQKRGLPGALMTRQRRGHAGRRISPRLAYAEYSGRDCPLPYSPCQNAKQESFWATLEGRLMAMLEALADLTLERLNEITQARVEQEYPRTTHAEIGTCPLRRYPDNVTVGRDCPDSETLRRAFRLVVTRRQRRSDGTLSSGGVRFEVPSRYCHLETPPVSYARRDLSAVELIDPRSLTVLCALRPLDKTTNADGQRRRLQSKQTQPATPLKTDPELPPLLRKLLADYAATGLSPRTRR